MNLALVFKSKTQMVKILYFSIMCSGNSWKILIYTRQYKHYYYYLFSVITKEINQIRNINNKSSLYCISPCFHILLCTHYGPLQCFSRYFRKSKEIRVLWPKFLGYVISCDYAPRAI